MTTPVNPKNKVMNKHARSNAGDLRAASQLAVSATTSVAQVVQDMHVTIGSGPQLLGKPLERPVKFFTDLVYGPIVGITNLVGSGIDKALAALEPILGDSTPGPEREAVVAALNGVLGDHLAASGNPLAIPMAFRSQGQVLTLTPEELLAAFPAASGKLLVLVHGSSMSDRGWLRKGHDHGAALEKDLGYTPVYLHYNSGLHISDNGRAFAALLEELCKAWPVPLTELSIVGHSMGGLVARSACHVAETDGLAWRQSLRKLVCLGTPHHGSPVERGGSLIHSLIGISRYSAPIARLAQIRSAGVTDMRFGYISDEHWHGQDRFERAADRRRELALPTGVECFAMAASTAKETRDKLPGDGLVPVDSALGRHTQPGLTLNFPEANTWIALSTSHLDLLHQPAVYDKLKTWLSS